MKKRKPFKKYIWLPALLFVYGTASFVVLYPKNDAPEKEKWITMALFYVIVAALAWLYYKKEKMRQKREDDCQSNDDTHHSEKEGEMDDKHEQ